MPEEEPEFVAPPPPDEEGEEAEPKTAPKKESAKTKAARRELEKLRTNNHPPIEKAVLPGKFLEYEAPDGTAWRCDNPGRLCADFQIAGPEKEAQVTKWHGDVATVREVWGVLRRVYRLAPLLGGTRDDLREWSMEEIAKEAAVTVKRVEDLLEETKIYWTRKCSERHLVTRAAEGIRSIDAETVEKLLLQHGFRDVPETDRKYLATRIVEFQHLLEDEQGAQLARTALMQEIILREYDRRILNQIQKDPAASSQKALDEMVEKRGKQQEAYGSIMERLGATHEQNPGYRAKVAFGDSLGHMVKAVQAYYQDGNNELVDGMFTAAEIKLLMTPTSLRPAQYRPDLPLMVADWQANFWNANYEGAKIPREAHRILLQTFRKAAEEFAEGRVADMDEEAEEETVEVALETPDEGLGGNDEFGSGPGAAGGMPMPTEGGAGTMKKGRGEEVYGGL